ncbi:hypothetical protein MNBD_GAMMA09-3766 [hydrothermal vent metagenome]|uniref:Yip1 domain-containing protein n=1 Tax=hydrothermal vent metagenome TaxID=652676 RepID=A0A3B0X486_9ZZZZ
MANNFFKILIGNLFLTKGPQDFPFSTVLMVLCLLANFITGVLVSQSSVELDIAVLAMIVDIAVLLLFVYLVLRGLSKAERFVQTVISLASIGVVYQVIAFIWLNNIDIDVEAPEELKGVAIAFFIFSSWSLAVITHVFRSSFEVRLPLAMVLTICYITISLLAHGFFFPESITTGSITAEPITTGSTVTAPLITEPGK